MSSLQYATDLLRDGLSYAAAARASNMNEIDLRNRRPPPARERPLPSLHRVIAPKPRAQPIARTNSHPVMARDVIQYVAAAHGRTFADMCSERRTRAFARPRQIAMYCVRHLCPHISTPEIGRRLGGRDHTTVLHGVRKISALVGVDAEIALFVAETLAHFRDAARAQMADEEVSPIAAAVAFQSLCAQYGQAMKAAA